jgi:hypothetical protein
MLKETKALSPVGNVPEWGDTYHLTATHAACFNDVVSNVFSADPANGAKCLGGPLQACGRFKITNSTSYRPFQWFQIVFFFP